MGSPLPRTLPAPAETSAIDRGILGVVLVVLVASPWPLGSRLPWAAMAAAAIVVASGSGWFIARLWGNAMPRHTPLHLPIAGFLAWVALQWLAGWTIYRHGTAYDGILMLSYAIVFIACVEIARYRDVARLLHTTTLWLAFAVGTFGLVQYLTWNGRLYWLFPLPYGGTTFGPFNNRNYFAGYLVATLTVAVAALLAEGLPRNRKLFLYLTWVSALALLVSLSRGGFVAFGVACVAAVLLCHAAADRLPRSRKGGAEGRSSGATWDMRGRPARVVAVAAVALFAGVLWLGQGDRVFSRLETLLRFQQESTFLGRLGYWEEALHMIADRPLTGFGLGSYVWVFPNYRDVVTNQLQTNAHNEYLEMAAETGLIGAALCTLFLVLLFRIALTRVRAAADREELGIRVGALCSWIGICVYALTDFPTVIPAINYVLAVQAALVVADIGARESH